MRDLSTDSEGEEMANHTVGRAMSMTTSPQSRSGGVEEDKLAAGTKVARLNEDHPRMSKPKCAR